MSKEIAAHTGSGLDVFECEPIGVDHPFCAMDNVVLTPHNASWADSTFDSLYRRIGEAAWVTLDGGIRESVANPKVLAHRRT